MSHIFAIPSVPKKLKKLKIMNITATARKLGVGRNRAISLTDLAKASRGIKGKDVGKTNNNNKYNNNNPTPTAAVEVISIDDNHDNGKINITKKTKGDAVIGRNTKRKWDAVITRQQSRVNEIKRRKQEIEKELANETEMLENLRALYNENY